MSIADWFFSSAASLPPAPIKSSSLAVLDEIAPQTEPQRYLTLVLLCSAVVGLIVALAANALGALIAISAGLLLFGITAYALLRLPEAIVRKHNAEIEAGLPQTLRIIALLISFGLPFQRALGVIAGEKGSVGRPFRDVCNEVERGVALSRALGHAAATTRSRALKRAFASLLSVYEHGHGSREINAIANELLALQQHAIRDGAARSAMLGLAFIACAALLPVFFLIIALLSKPLLHFNISQLDFALMMIIVFPAISFAVLMLAKEGLPLSPFRRQHTSFSAFFDYKGERRKEEIESAIPDALFSVAGLPKGSKIEHVFRTIGNGGYGPLSEEAMITLRQLSSGVKPELALEDLWQRNNSEMLRRASQMLIHALNTNSLERLGEVADDILRFSEIERERRALLAPQKYTLLFGGLLIPVVVKIALLMTEKMVEFLSDAAVLIPAAHSLMPVYLILYASMTAYYISSVEGRLSMLLPHLVGLSAVGLIIFSIVSL